MSETVLAERRGPVLLLTLNRPEKLNAWSDELEARYFELLDEAEADPEVRAIVLTGAGRGFCAGADFDDLKNAPDDDPTIFDRPRPRYLPLTLRKPLIAAVNGATAGLGLVAALYCDIRFCTPEAKLTTAFVQRGLIAEYGSAWILPRLVGPGAAADLLLSGRVVRGAEAKELGLVDRLVEPEKIVEAAVDYATDMAQKCSPAAIAVIKEQLRSSADSTFAESFEDAEVKIRESFRHADVREGVASYLERRPPDFAPPAPAGLEG